ncbi:hypothetical protein BAUCODRAFT_35108 [Baudoinia panamericana UAMH 10762]|uniref:Histone deacetylase interacting domain-containing protein n=1 Tax=Baudoinia panamericana (strain UAMH 10762) TaxID=717646 RepID=M2LLG2_BAUPA|nr:uncharacterized protein BAUCODRAFT_35108 [Baudoinia panamericana UAMH 10762]EMC95117.1 hypothetical protein BAUCODRAFT_35108 [Baudoinia panamericana UAMH 10762]
MDPAHRGWPPPSGGSTHASNGEQAPRAGATFGTPQQHSAPSPSVRPVGLPPPPGNPFPPFHQASHGLAAHPAISQSSPRQIPISHGPDRPPLQAPGFPLPNISQATGQPGIIERERERERVEQIHIKEEEDRRHREIERQRLEQAPPHQPQQGPPMLHQPVAVGHGRVHGPNGILGNPQLSGPQPPPQMPLGAPSGPINIFAGAPGQAAQPPPQPMQQGLLMPFAPVPHPQPSQQQQMGQGQGQQPILNDALSYLDQVKVQFADHPDVYNRFLDIMKDFKSGAIDTPGVIGRVSTLFAGNPELIQGFNTFLPPGYRIECGTSDDPNAIRVTTPMGTTVSSMPQPRPLSRQDGTDGLRPTTGTYTPQPGAQTAKMMFSPSGRPVGPAAPGRHLSPLEAARQQEAIHAQEQRGVSSLQNAVSAATGAGGLRAGMSPRATPLPGQVTDGQLDGTAGMEKRPPVEFNHAISYVNKIKNRFSSHPDIYKQFLEILQTYQRESKPIQDVYGQVTHLFKTAPDLLEDFKQFLPESAAQAKAAERARQAAEENAMMSNARDGGLYGSPVISRETHMGTPHQGRQLPPVGNFAPTPMGKDNKKRKVERQETVDSMAGISGVKAPLAGQASKRQKQTHTAVAKPGDQPPSSPGLVPRLPEPLPPTTTAAATSEEMSFFERVKKAIGNKGTFSEFLKLCNLFNQDLIDRATVAFRAKSFIGNHPDLTKWFENFLGIEDEAIVIENKPRIPSGRVSLSNCRGLGPSYRLLPKRERQKTCSGRDELCNSVLNDEWASHPTWASEDSGFIAHRKNVHEEGLHRIEEERHDYDYNIEACSRTIQLLEPIAQQLRRLSDADQRAFKLPPGLGGQSETIYKRIIMKIYGREKGHDVIEQLHVHPYQVIPVLLNRLKERLETWKYGQREWDKVWREQTQKMFWKSLDHQAVNNAKGDKKQFQAKFLQSEIQTKHEEMRAQENINHGTLKRPQMESVVRDMDVVVDITHLLLQYVHMSMEVDHPRLAGFLREFVPLFFGIDAEGFNAQLKARSGGTPQEAEVVEEASYAEDAAFGRGRKMGKPGGLLRTALDRGRQSKMGRRDDTSISRASTPDVASNAGDAEEMAIDTTEETESRNAQQPTQRWFEHPGAGNDAFYKNDVDPNEPQKREVYKMWTNTALYCFVRMFNTMYDRLHKLKSSEADVAKAVRNAEKPKPAIELGIVDKLPGDFFGDIGPTANYYSQMLGKFEDVLKGEYEFAEVEDTLRRFYLNNGYHLYAFEKMVSATARFALSVLNSEGKEKGFEIWQAFKKDRSKETTTVPQQTDYRKSVERLIKDGELYRIDWDEDKRKIMYYLVRKTDPAYFDDGLSPLDLENRWRAYVASYQTVDDTDNVPRDRLNPPFLLRNARNMGMNPISNSYPPSPPIRTIDGDSAESAGNDVLGHDRAMTRLLAARNEENLIIRIRVNDYVPQFQPNTQEGFMQPFEERQGGSQGVRQEEEAETEREEVMRERWIMNNEAMRDLRKEEVEARNKGFGDLVQDAGERAAEEVMGEEKMEVE